jgi:hypothetical protein
MLRSRETILVHYCNAEIERLRKIEKAARDVAETLNGGFVVCAGCGEQESTTDLDFARELYQALGVQEKKRVRKNH